MKNKLSTLTLLATVFIFLFVTLPNAENSNLFQSEGYYKLSYTLNRPADPELFYDELTYLINIGESLPYLISADGKAVTFQHDPQSNILKINTAGSQLDILLLNVDNPTQIGALEKAPLWNNYGFAWSLGMDDNVNLKEQIDVFERYSWRGTLFLIANILVDDRDEDWIVDPQYLRTKLDSGWSLGNHTWDHACNSTINEQKIIDGHNRLREVVDGSNTPNYKITSFAAPCFVSEYHPVILDMRARQVTDVQFNESGSRTPMILNPQASSGIVLDLNQGSVMAQPFDVNEPIGRGINVEVGDTSKLIDIMDKIAARYASHGDHLWHNTLVHGNKTDEIETVASYLHATYGANGTNQLWVAPSDQIVSYMLVRDNTTINLTNSDFVDNPNRFKIFLTSIISN